MLAPEWAKVLPVAKGGKKGKGGKGKKSKRGKKAAAASRSEDAAAAALQAVVDSLGDALDSMAKQAKSAVGRLAKGLPSAVQEEGLELGGDSAQLLPVLPSAAQERLGKELAKVRADALSSVCAGQKQALTRLLKGAMDNLHLLRSLRK